MRTMLSNIVIYKFVLACVFKIVFPICPGSGDMFLDETYANGDGTDSWCTTNQQIPAALYDYQTYTNPQCDVWSCFFGDMQAGTGYTVRHTTASSLCANRNVNYTDVMHIVCM
jgi:hypothetical protein